MAPRAGVELYKPFYRRGVTPAQKKYSVYVLSPAGNAKIIHFGAAGMAQYHDKGGRYAKLDHGDRARRARYRARHVHDRIDDKNTPGYWSWYYLW
jgi:hypothetical protein